MRNRTVSGCVCAWLLLPALALGQTEEIQKGIDEKLAEERRAADTLLAEVLKNNPDIRVAEAKVAEAQAELERTRLTVLAQAAGLQAEIRAQERRVESIKRKLALTRELVQTGVVNHGDLLDEEAAMLTAEAQREALTQQLQALRGEVKGAGMHFRIRPVFQGNTLRLGFQFCPAGQGGDPKATANCANCHSNPHVTLTQDGMTVANPGTIEPEPGSMTDRIMKALDKPVTAEESVGVPLEDALMFLREAAGGDIPFRYIAPAAGGGAVKMPEVTMIGGELTLGARLLHIEDSTFGLQVVIRPYGLLVTTNPPANAMFLSNVWPRRKETDKEE